MPSVDVAPARLGTSALFSYRDWSLGIGTGLLGTENKPLPADVADKLTKTVYHEARHAEQYYLMARSRAAYREPMDAPERSMGIPRDVAAAAAADPLPMQRDADYMYPAAVAPDAVPSPTAYWTDARGACADRWYDSIYGAGAAARNQLLNVELPEKQRINRDADRAEEAARMRYGAGSPEHARAMAVWQAASADLLATRGRYEQLPEEADAWAIEALLR